MSRELKDLGTTVTLRRARRGRWARPAFVGVLLLVGVVAWLGGSADSEPTAAAGHGLPAVTAGPIAPDAAQDAVPAASLPVLGRVGDLLLHVPAADPVLVSYHEASFPAAQPLTALGTLTGNDNPTRPLATEAHEHGLPFHVQVSRGRANASTSAVDVVLAPDQQVRSPVAGTVTDVRPYQLYGAHDDVRLELQPDGTELVVVLIHIEDVAVRAGDRVEVGDVLAANARSFPFGAVVDRQTEPERYGHVHLEVKAPE